MNDFWPLRFLADATCGRLAKWLRILGYDTLFEPKEDTAGLVRLARAEDRVLLTRDTRLARRHGVCVLLVKDESLEQQLDQLHGEFGVCLLAPWTRCPICNETLMAVPRDQAWGQVPPYVFVTQEGFRLCPQCNRFYWKGTHRDRMHRWMARWSRKASCDAAPQAPSGSGG